MGSQSSLEAQCQGACPQGCVSPQLVWTVATAVEDPANKPSPAQPRLEQP